MIRISAHTHTHSRLLKNYFYSLRADTVLVEHDDDIIIDQKSLMIKVGHICHDVMRIVDRFKNLPVRCSELEDAVLVSISDL